MEIPFEKLIEIIVKEVAAELSKRGITVASSPEDTGSVSSQASRKQLCEIIDLKNYKSPVLTENHLASLDSNVREIVLPKGTVITPGARDIISKRELIIRSNHKSN